MIEWIQERKWKNAENTALKHIKKSHYFTKVLIWLPPCWLINPLKAFFSILQNIFFEICLQLPALIALLNRFNENTPLEIENALKCCVSLARGNMMLFPLKGPCPWNIWGSSLMGVHICVRGGRRGGWPLSWHSLLYWTKHKLSGRSKNIYRRFTINFAANFPLTFSWERLTTALQLMNDLKKQVTNVQCFVNAHYYMHICTST